jgi:hypothetical protein
LIHAAAFDYARRWTEAGMLDRGAECNWLFAAATYQFPPTSTAPGGSLMERVFAVAL